MQQARVALLALLDPRVPADVDVPLPEAGRRLGAQPLHDGALTAGGEKLRHKTSPPSADVRDLTPASKCSAVSYDLKEL